jgi:hypothetical protein
MDVIIKFVFKYWKLALAAVILIAVFGAGFLAARKFLKPKIITNTVTEEKIVEKKVYIKTKDTKKTTVISENKDGSRTTTIVEETKEKTKSNKEIASDLLVSKKQEVARITSLKIGLFVTHNLDYRIAIQKRLFWGFWAGAGYQIKQKEVSVGILYEF